MTEFVRVDGLDELRRTLRNTLPDHLHSRALDGALQKAAKLIVEEARNRVPRRTGVLRRAIHQMRSKFSTRTRPSRIIRVRHGKKQQKSNRDAFYWRFIEFGRGVITAKNTSVLGTHESGFFGKEVKAVPAQPFMRPAFETRKRQALDVFRDSLAGEIRKVAERAFRASKARLGRSLLRSF